jgi:predicted PurR-regulated permease PerM
MVTATLIVLAAYLLVRFWVVVTPLLIAGIVAYILSPLVGRLEQRLKLPRWLATLLVYLVLITALLTVPALIIPVIIERLGLLGAALEDIVEIIETTMIDSITIGEFTFESAQIVDQAVGALRDLIEPVFGRTLGLAFGVLSSVVMAVFIIVISFYLVKDSLKLRRWVRSLPPESYREDFRRLALQVNEVWGSFFRGQLMLALVVGTGFILAGYILGLPFALAMGVLAGLMEFVPSVGHTIWITIASILIYFLGSSWIPVPNWVMMVIVIGLHMIFAQFDLNYLIPRIIGRRINLHPLVIILGIIAGASVAGVLGVVLAAPTIATARVLGRYLYANLFDQDPFPRLAEGGS